MESLLYAASWPISGPAFGNYTKHHCSKEAIMPIRDLLRHAKNSPILGPISLPCYRAWIASIYVFDRLALALKWLLSSKETTNFTYAISPRNTVYLASLLSDALDVPRSRVLSLFDELTENREVAETYSQLSGKLPYRLYTDPLPMFGRRLAWYAVVRIKAPKIVVETGVDKGLGSLVICAALLKNATEGSPGRYYGLDINPNAGFLLQGKFRCWR